MGDDGGYASGWRCARSTKARRRASNLLADATGRPVDVPGQARRTGRLERCRSVVAACQPGAAIARLLDQAITKAEATSDDVQESAAAGQGTHRGDFGRNADGGENLAKSRATTTSAKENQTKRDADMADVLERIDERIIELAIGYARKLGERKSEPDEVGLIAEEWVGYASRRAVSAEGRSQRPGW